MDKINDMLMAAIFGDDWKELFADPVRKAEIQKKLTKDLEIKRMQWEDEVDLSYVTEFDFDEKSEEE